GTAGPPVARINTARAFHGHAHVIAATAFGEVGLHVIALALVECDGPGNVGLGSAVKIGHTHTATATASTSPFAAIGPYRFARHFLYVGRVGIRAQEHAPEIVRGQVKDVLAS